ncbi:MAG TPA: TIGR03560 family F420-dependent LLM class oxidoreductase [Actinomycetota bacterium]|nr:TIGR03560 family F420-dependent LLM class oxidoreductase [Actinomycetota bacterium]
MDVCLMIEGQEGVTWDEWLSLALACEEHGFDGLFRSDHYLSFDHPMERGAFDAWSTLAALASITERIRLGTLVSPVGFRHPALLSKAVVTVDHASDGRAELGVGAGWFEREHKAFGFTFPPTAERHDVLAEQVEIVHRLWDRNEDAVDFDGTHYRLEACPSLPKAVQDPHPPLIVGGGAGPRSAALAARWADEYNVVFSDPPTAREQRERVRAACASIGRDPDELRFSVMTRLVIGADDDEVRERARALMEVQDERGDVDEYIEGMRSNMTVGTPEQVLDRLRAFAEAGAERVFLQHLVHDDLEAVALIGREVVPEAGRL